MRKFPDLCCLHCGQFGVTEVSMANPKTAVWNTTSFLQRNFSVHMIFCPRIGPRLFFCPKISARIMPQNRPQTFFCPKISPRIMPQSLKTVTLGQILGQTVILGLILGQKMYAKISRNLVSGSSCTGKTVTTTDGDCATTKFGNCNSIYW